MPYATCPWSDTAPTSERPWLQAPRTPFSASSTQQDTTRQPSLQKIQALQRRPSARWHDLCACVCNPPHHVGTWQTRAHTTYAAIPAHPIRSDPVRSPSMMIVAVSSDDGAATNIEQWRRTSHLPGPWLGGGSAGQPPETCNGIWIAIRPASLDCSVGSLLRLPN